MEYGQYGQSGSQIIRETMAVTKFYATKVYSNEYKPVHTRSMDLNASNNAVNYLAGILDYKGNNKLTIEDLKLSPDIISYSDRPSANPININGGWGVNRFTFFMEITIFESATTQKRIYLSGYTEDDDLLSPITHEINRHAKLVFNDVLVTKSVINPDMSEVTRIVTTAEILPTPDRQDGILRDATLTPADVYKVQQGRNLIPEDEYRQHGVVMRDARLINVGGKLSDKTNMCLDQHLVKVTNAYIGEKAKLEVPRSDADVIADLTWSSKEQDIRGAVALFRLLDEMKGIRNTNTVEVGDILDICPMHFAHPQSDYCININPYGMPEIELSSAISNDRSFNALSTMDSESTASTNVETKMAFAILQETMSLMSLFKVTSIAISATNFQTDRNGDPLITMPTFRTFVRGETLGKLMYEKFKQAFINVFDKISMNRTDRMLMMEFHLFIGFSSEKIEIKVDGGHKVVISLPRFASSHHSNVVGSVHDLNILADSYNELFKVVGEAAMNSSKQRPPIHANMHGHF